MRPVVINGGSYSDNRGDVTYNNDFDMSSIKRIYSIQNVNTSLVRAWQGHAIERRWFSVLKGSFEIKLIKIDNWENPTKSLEVFSRIINDENFDVLCVPGGYVSSIQALEENSKLLLMSDYRLVDIEDEYRFDSNYFT
jgi:dTDP-4-dehydrorhamnose 3,5-epimerase-like enzyme